MKRLLWDYDRQPKEVGKSLRQWAKEGNRNIWGYLWECRWQSNRSDKSTDQDDISQPINHYIIDRIGQSGDYLQESVQELKNWIKSAISSLQFRGSAFNNGENDKTFPVSVALCKWAGKEIMKYIGRDTSQWESIGKIITYLEILYDWV